MQDCPDLELSQPNELPALSVTCERVEQFAREHGLSAKMIYALNLCIEELIVNLIAYAYPDEASHQINLYLVLKPEGLVITLSDDGVAFNPWTHGEMDQERAAMGLGGLGLGLVKAQIDWCDYERKDGWNLVNFRIPIAS